MQHVLQTAPKYLFKEQKHAQTFSYYKSHNTYKALYCVAPNGFVIVSKLFGGCASDVFITQNSGLEENLLPGDEVLADRGFTIDGILPQGVTLTIPAFTKGHKDKRLPEEEVTRTRRIANVRIHVRPLIVHLYHIETLYLVLDLTVLCSLFCVQHVLQTAPKYLLKEQKRAQTFSNYKSHNTYKAL